MVHLSLLERVGLGGSFNRLLWELICIVSHLLASEALNLTDVSFSRLTSIATTTMVALVSTLVVLIIIIVMAAVVLVVMVTVVVVVVVVLPMLVESITSTTIIMGTFVRRSRAVLIKVMLPLPALNLFHIVLQDGGLVTK